MIEKIRALQAEYVRLQEELQDPAVFNNPKEVQKRGKRISELEPVIPMLKRYDACEQAIAVLSTLQNDPELLQLAEEEAAQAREAMPKLLAEMKKFLLPRDPHDSRGVILEVRAGTGGEEAALFAAEQLRMYLRYAESRGWKAEMLDISHAEAGGVKEVSARIQGDGVYGDLKFESGVHRVQRIPATENKGRVHTSTTTIAILPEAEEVDVVVRNEDLRVDTYRSGGAGGQHVNKTESAVRITHIPTGTVVACQSERSQLQNRALAMTLLRSRIYAAEQERLAKERKDMRSGQVGTADRSEKIRTYNFPQDRITDHRANINFSNIPAIMEGEMGDIVAGMKQWEEEQLLAQVR